ncbi:MAG: DUF3137 domain-containing protein [Proteobacteria bacterium]|nr:DUF3137 domain-containing protein [Pseudomonadota bacterium]
MAKNGSITEKSPHEDGFAAVFAAEIAPRLETVEVERKRRQRAIRTRALIVGGIAIALVVAAILGLSLQAVEAIAALAAVVLAAAVALGWRWVFGPRKAHRDALREVLVGPVCRFLGGLRYARDPEGAVDSRRFAAHGLVADHEESHTEDLFEGRHRGTSFRMVEARLRARHSARAGRRQHNVFQGLLFEVQVPVPFGGRTLISADRGLVADAIGGLFEAGDADRIQKVGFDDPAFESRYQTYSDDPAEARRLMSPAFRANLVALAEAHEEPPLGAAFAEGIFRLALPTKRDLFEPGSIWRPALRSESDARRLLAEVAIPIRVIDYLHGVRPSGAG